MDNVNATTRSKIMASVKSRGNRSTEKRMRALMIRSGLNGWKIQAHDITGNPDFAFHKQKVAIFVDGCFWHGCPTCCRIPATNTEYWTRKIRKNIQRDTMYRDHLVKDGWEVLRFWEHDVKNSPDKLVLEIKSAVLRRSAVLSD